MGEINCYGVSGRIGLVLGGFLDVGICFEDDFPYVSPSGRIGFGASIVGAATSFYQESTDYDTSTSYAAETDESWFRVNVSGTDFIPIIGRLFSSGRSDSDYKDDNVQRTDYMLGLCVTFPVVDEWGETAPAGNLSFDILALAWNGFFDAAETAWNNIGSAATYVGEGVSYAAETTWDGACAVVDNAVQYWETVFNW